VYNKGNPPKKKKKNPKHNNNNKPKLKQSAKLKSANPQHQPKTNKYGQKPPKPQPTPPKLSIDINLPF